MAGRSRDYCEPEGILPEEPCGYRSWRSTADVMFVVRRLQELPMQDTPPHMFFIDLTKALTSFDRAEPSCGLFSPALACHRKCSRPSANSTTSCEHMTG